MVRHAEPLRVHRLNNTASVILELCDGQRTLAEAFGLDVVPLAEAAACVAGLRQAGVLVGRTHYSSTTVQIAESRSR